MKPIDTLLVGQIRDYNKYFNKNPVKDKTIFVQVPGSRKPSFNSDNFFYGPLSSILKTIHPQKAIFLSSYRGIVSDIKKLLKEQVEVRTAGPIENSSITKRHGIIDIYKTDEQLQVMLGLSQKLSFGNPIYLRIIASSQKTLLNKWWSAFQLCRLATRLLNSPLKHIYIAANGRGPQLHASITLTTKQNTISHLIVPADNIRVGDDILFLGTGGTLSVNTLINSPGILTKSDLKLYPNLTPQNPNSFEDNDKLDFLNSGDYNFYQQLLACLRKSYRKGSSCYIENLQS